ncbi:MAG: S41 family peptidase [Candidatus Acidiferrales bacterium]
MSRVAKTIIIIISLLIFTYVAVGYVHGQTSDNKTYRALTVYSEVLEHIQRDYVEDPDMHAVTSGALHGLLDSLDPQSSYMSPLEYTDYKQKMETKAPAELGLTVSKRFGYIIIISVLPDSPAAKAGLHSGDLLETIAGFTTTQMSISQAQTLLTGQPGASVKLEVIHRGKSETETVELNYGRVPAPRLLDAHLEADIGYLKVPAFGIGMTKQIRDALAQFQHAGVRSLVLDLRNCSSGEMAEAVSTAQLFLTSGTIASERGQTVSTETFSADPSKVVWRQPVDVLISGGTAGPAEIVAAAIGENHRGDTIGESATFGEASAQRVIPLDDGAAIILTVANYFTPAGKPIPPDGVTPSIEVHSTSDFTEPAAGQVVSPDDPVVKRAIEALENPAQKKVAAATRARVRFVVCPA